jgi:hypothetical protein
MEQLPLTHSAPGDGPLGSKARYVEIPSNYGMKSSIICGVIACPLKKPLVCSLSKVSAPVLHVHDPTGFYLNPERFSYPETVY